MSEEGLPNVFGVDEMDGMQSSGGRRKKKGVRGWEDFFLSPPVYGVHIGCIVKAGEEAAMHAAPMAGRICENKGGRNKKKRSFAERLIASAE